MKFIISTLLLIFLFFGCIKKPGTTPDTSVNKNKVDSLKHETGDTTVKSSYILCDKYKIVKDSLVNADKDSLVVFSITYPLIDGIDDINRRNLINTQLKNAAITSYDAFDKNANMLDAGFIQNMAKEMNKDSLKFQGEVSYEIKQCKNDFLSLCYYYLGIQTPSVHPTSETKCVNIDMSNGELLQLEKVFKKDADIKKIIIDNVRNDMEKQGIPFSEPDNLNNRNYYFTDSTIGFSNLYTTHAMASYELVVHIDELKNKFDENFLKRFGK